MTTMTKAAADAAWEELIADQSESAPGTYLQEGQVLSRGQDGDESAAPIRVSDLRYKGYVQVWDTKTGDESLQPWWLLWQTMRKRHPDGTLVFTRTNPHIPPEYGEDLFCPLNPQAPKEQRFGGRGYKPCTKRHIPHWDGLQRHIKKSHPRASEAIERAKRDEERAEDRALAMETVQTQRDFMKALLVRDATLSGIADVPEVRKPRQPATGDVTKVCDVCQQEFHGTLTMAVVNKLGAHKRREHPVVEAAVSD